MPVPDGVPAHGGVLLATRNPGKLEEMARLLEELAPGVRLLGVHELPDQSRYDEPVEDAPDFVGNALLKAHAGLAATGLPTIADDSGLCVAALNQMPGVLSARWSGRPTSDERNNTLVLDQLHDVPDARREAAFRCAAALVWRDAGGRLHERVTEGVMTGRLARTPRGTGGFGYDSIFVPDGHEQTSAELTPQAKDAISHRGKAMREMALVVAEAFSSRR